MEMRVLRVILVVAVAVFFLPWMMVSCDGKPGIALSGSELAFGKSAASVVSAMSQGSDSGMAKEMARELAKQEASGTGPSRSPGDLKFVSCLVLSICALLATWLLRARLQWLVPAGLSLLGAIATAGVSNFAIGDLAKQGGGMMKISAHFEYGYYLELATFIAACALALFASRKGQVVIVAPSIGLPCTNCGSALKAGAAFCASCGTKTQQSKRCPQCGAENPAEAKFCRMDGFRLDSAVAPASIQQPAVAKVASFESAAVATAPLPKQKFETPATRPVTQAPATTKMQSVPSAPARKIGAAVWISAAVVVVLTLAGGSGYLYWTGVIGDRPGSVAKTIVDELTTNGFPGLSVAVNKEWVATVTGGITGQDRRQQVLDQFKTHTEIKKVVDSLEVKASAAELQQQLDRALAANGLTAVHGTVGEDYVVTLIGSLDTQMQRNTAIQISHRLAGIKNVDDKIQKSIAWKQRDANQSLRNAGLATISASFLDERTVALAGMVNSPDERVQAEQVLLSTDSALNLQNNIEVRVVAPSRARSDRFARTNPSVATSQPVQQSQPAQAVQQPQQAVQRNRVLGVWSGKVHQGALFGYDAELRVNSDAIGQTAGTTKYASAGTIDCVGEIKLLEITADSAMLEETITKRGLLCPGGGNIKIQLQSGNAASVEWYRKNKPNKVAVNGSVSRQ